MVGICTGLYTEEGAQAVEFVWVDTLSGLIDIQSTLPDTGIEFCYYHFGWIPCPPPGERFYGQDAHYMSNPMSFKDHGDGTVTDNVTGLMWQQGDDDSTRTWCEAVDYCEALHLAGHTDWRLPDEYELQGIVDYGRFGPSIDTTYFPGTNPSDYWSSFTYAYTPFYALKVDFLDGYVGFRPKIYSGYILCVR